MKNKKLLLLGGTADARQLATSLHKQGVPIIYSIAGIVRKPDIPCKVVSGGFTQYGGLMQFIQQQQIAGILNATHPYTVHMTQKAVLAAEKLDLPYWRFYRSPWQQQIGDDWREYKSWEQLIPNLKEKKSIFLTAGQIDQSHLDKIVSRLRRFILLRTAVKPKYSLGKDITWIKAIGPFSEETEAAIMEQYQIDTLVSKNSGGKATVAKINVARKMKIPVYMLQRPNLPKGITVFNHYDPCISDIINYFIKININ